MSTFADIVGMVKQQLMGYTKDQVAITYLTQPMTSTDVTFTVDTETVNAVSRGLVEVDEELVLVKKYDRTSGLVTVMAGLNGRGSEGTHAAAHTVNTIVTADPDYPIHRIKEAINDCIQATYPDLFAFSSFEFKKNAARYEYPIPPDAESVYKVTADTIGPSKIWFPVQRWRFNNNASMDPVEGVETGKSVQVMDAIVPGRTIRVIYTKAPNTLIDNTDEFVITGYPERYIDMITYGAVARLLPAYESARLQQSAIESNERAPLVPTQAATQASQYYWNMYYKRLAEERDRLFELNQQYQSFLS